VRSAALLVVAVLAAAPPRYAATRAGDVVRLEDRASAMSAAVLTTHSNAYEIQVHGQNVLRMPFASLDEFKARPGLNGIPLLAPFANRLDEQAFYANGKKYNFDMELGNVRGAIPIHGFLSGATDWTLVEARADSRAAWVTCRLEFYRNPQYMQQFPFAHTITMTYRLAGGVLEVRTRLDNLSREPMPVAIGFHPYFQLTEGARPDWTLSVGAKTHWLLAPNLIPTGETEPIEKRFADPRNVALKDLSLDDVFTDLERDAEGRATVSIKGAKQQLDVLIGPKFKTVLVYLPALSASNPALSRGSVAIEPMAAVTNALNLAHKGRYQELQSVPPNGSWAESFWIHPRGFWRGGQSGVGAGSERGRSDGRTPSMATLGPPD
jgi:aldose 1-epimerase